MIFSDSNHNWLLLFISTIANDQPLQVVCLVVNGDNNVNKSDKRLIVDSKIRNVVIIRKFVTKNSRKPTTVKQKK